MADAGALLLGAAIGGGTSILTTSIIQLWVNPGAASRVRAHERWERALIEMGELLSTALPEARDRMQQAWDSWVWMQERADAGELDREDDQFNQLAHKLEADNDDARRDWDRYVARLEWLSHLVSDRRDPTMDLFEQRVHLYRLGSPLVIFGLWGEFRPELVDQEWQREAKVRDELLALVRQLIEMMVSRRGGSAARLRSSARRRLGRTGHRGLADHRFARRP